MIDFGLTNLSLNNSKIDLSIIRQMDSQNSKTTTFLIAYQSIYINSMMITRLVDSNNIFYCKKTHVPV